MSMTNDFLEIPMQPSRHGRGGFFAAEASFILDNFRMPFERIRIRIDTGCSISTIPIRRLKVSPANCLIRKTKDILDDVPYVCSYGVETGGMFHPMPNTFDEKMKCEAMKFHHRIQSLAINGMPIPADDIYLNYNRSGNILIGMDIIGLMDNHIGKSRKTGDVTFLACPYGTVGTFYYDALKEHFGITIV